MPSQKKKTKTKMRYVFYAIVAIQSLCALFFVLDISMDVFHWRSKPVSWGTHELLEISAVLGLLLGLVVSYLLFRNMRQEYKKSLSQNNALRSEFSAYIIQQFKDWDLSASEVDVAWGLIKGYTNKEIAQARGTAEGTVKVQASGVLAKAGVENRQQFIGLFIEEIIGQQGEL